MTEGQTAEMNKLTSAWAMATALHSDIADLALRCSQLGPHSFRPIPARLWGRTESGGFVTMSFHSDNHLKINWSEKDRFTVFEILLPISAAKPTEDAA